MWRNFVELKLVKMNEIDTEFRREVVWLLLTYHLMHHLISSHVSGLSNTRYWFTEFESGILLRVSSIRLRLKVCEPEKERQRMNLGTGNLWRRKEFCLACCNVSYYKPIECRERLIICFYKLVRVQDTTMSIDYLISHRETIRSPPRLFNGLKHVLGESDGGWGSSNGFVEFRNNTRHLYIRDMSGDGMNLLERRWKDEFVF